jgi:hypothetical protein
MSWVLFGDVVNIDQAKRLAGYQAGLFAYPQPSVLKYTESILYSLGETRHYPVYNIDEVFIHRNDHAPF